MLRLDASSQRTKPVSRFTPVWTGAKREMKAVRGVAWALISDAPKRRAEALKICVIFKAETEYIFDWNTLMS